MSSEIDAALRWLKPQRKRGPLRRRGVDALEWVERVPAMGVPVLLDTTVYIDILQGRSPEALDALITRRTCSHSSVCLAELTQVFGRLDPADPRTAPAQRVIGQSIRDMPAHRVLTPDAAVWGAAGMLAGVMFRLGSYPRGAERRCLNDALLHLQGCKLGMPVVTANVADFDFLQQLVPDGRVLLYRRSD